ncbi:CRISPR-associated protein Cse1 [Thermobifida cellulosilytica TB100]|uniref:CRISPR-associated protein Cse1 n=1 Tax=Thermobifida cellulosilytica TB100 TaxID=665004 RepID=A0A147KKN6_THECS|nr:CRISPR-associated protein Cse1 [Thermobifida cellulosilytica TB100]
MTTAPWLVARGRDVPSAPEMLGLRDVLVRSHELADVELPLPPASAVLWRVLALVTARITGLDQALGKKSKSRWLARRAQLLSDGCLDPAAVDAYFAEHAGRFDLFHPERPWMQDPRLREECSKSSGVNKLAWGRTAGQNQVWLGGHHHDLDPQPLASAEAVWHLLATLGYGPSGRCTSRVVRGRNEANVTAGPLRGTVSYHPLGRTLFESLVLNIPYPGTGEVDLAPWERPDLNDPLGLPEEPTGLAGLLVNQFRHAVLVQPSPDGSQVVDAWVTWAWRERGAPPELDPHFIHQTSKEGRVYPRPAQAERAVWRDLDSLLRHGEDDGNYRPRILGDCTRMAQVPQEVLDALRLRAFGFDQDGQTRDKQWFTATTPAVLRWLEDNETDDTENARIVHRIGLARKSAEALGRRLEKACREAWKESNSPGSGGSSGKGVKTETGVGPWAHHGMSRYWSQAESVFWDIVYDRPTPGYTPGTAGPGNAFNLVALAAYDEVTGPYCERPRVAKVVERHRSALFDHWTPRQEAA